VTLPPDKETLDMQVHRLLGKCLHKWKALDRQFPRGSEYIYEDAECIKCGKIKEIEPARFEDTIIRDAEQFIDYPFYTTDLDAAWECIEFMREKQWSIKTLVYDNCFFIQIYDQENYSIVEHKDKSIKIAICKAFVRACGETPKPLKVAA